MAQRPLPESLLEFLDAGTFDNVWYWIITIVAWSVTCHWTLGVPHDAIIQADQKGGSAAAHVDAMARAGIARITGIMRSAGLWLGGAAGFFAAALATLGFWGGNELAKGLALLVVPLAIVAAFNVRLAFRLETADLQGAALRRALSRRRLWNQAIGLVAVTVAAALGLLHILRELVGPV